MISTDEVTKQELNRLPSWASVAFAAQCAELLWPCYLNLPADMERWTVLSVRKAIDLAKESAQEGRARDLVKPETVDAAVEAVSSATNQRAGFREMSEAAKCAAEAAFYALRAALSHKVAAMYAEKAADRFHYAAVFIWPHLRGKARQYYNYLLGLAECNNWSKDTTLPREIVDNPNFDPPPFAKWPQPGLHTAADKE
ncbi:MAG: hypothetical protein HZA46_13355 [Planctomycetales bacterium]|nr:hypothetical protein [Planctomycetales bacterium]